MLILLFLLAVFTAPALAQDALVPPPSPPEIYLSPITLHYNGAPLESGMQVGAFTFVDAQQLLNENYRFGGFSGLHFAHNTLFALSDEGQFLSANLLLGENRIRGFSGITMHGLMPENALIKEKKAFDAEALSPFGKQQFLVAFEQQHRIALYRMDPQPQLQQTWEAPATLKQRTKENEGIEALALLSTKQALALTEGALDENGNRLGYLVTFAANKWEPIAIKTHADFRPTDITVLDAQHLLLLERSYNILSGVEARISLITRKDIAPGAVLTPKELVLFDAESGIDNLEGITARKNPNGSFDIFLLSDDNFNPLQKTQLVWLRLALQPRR